MTAQGRFRWPAALAVVLVVSAAFAVLFYEGSATGGSGSSASGPSVTRSLTIAWDPSRSTYAYSLSNLQVPLGATVHFVITSYDPDPVASLPTAADASVSGTVGGTITVESAGEATTVDHLAPGTVSHTFTLSSGAYHLNVPIPAASSGGNPVVVRFSAVFATPGSFAWGCVIPCGGQDMTVFGTMFGTLLVA